MADLVGLLREVMTLTSNVQDLKSNVERIDKVVLNHHERIVKLESAEELIVEKCRNAAIISVSTLSSHLTKEVTELSLKMKQVESSKGRKSLPEK